VVALVKHLMPLLLQGEHPTLGILREQFQRAHIGAIRLSGVGFFADIVVPPDAPQVDPPRIVGGDCRIELSGVEHGASCVLFVSDGHLSMLEGYTCGEEWSENTRVVDVKEVTPIRPRARKVSVVHGDLLDQDVDVIVNAWNRNVIPWWLLVPQGLSRAIKRRAGYAPFRELGRMGPIPLGGAVLTTAGRLPHKAIIHVAGINLLWRSSEHSVRQCVRNALALARERGFRSIALPLIGAGTGGRRSDLVQAWIVEESQLAGFDGEVRVVRYSAS
jgi:O-acetyl-ADP-ribose deacetylase (regulator of RNase III)